FGDGGVDVSPIGDLVKSEVYALGRELGVNEAILQARPTDGLWSDGRTDEDQIGASYDELEWALDYCERHQIKSNEEVKSIGLLDKDLSAREQVVLNIYWSRHIANQHKMNLPPIAYLK
ncbi:MAG: synthase, partial [Pseudomonadota bacterium]|nr:synthase [Pseudomonadota bacterium]